MYSKALIIKGKFTQLLFLFIIISSAGYGQSTSSASLSADTVKVSKKPMPIHVVDINFELERTRKKLTKLSNDLKPQPQLVKLDSQMVIQKAFLENEVMEFKQFNPHNLSKFFLENTYRAWSGYEAKLEKWETIVNNYISNTQEHIDELGFSKGVWELTLEKAKAANDPKQLITRISEMIHEIDGLERKFMKYRREMIIREDNISELISMANNIQEEVSQLQQHLRDNLFVADKPSLWNVEFNTTEAFPIAPRLHKAWHENAKTIKIFSKEINYLYLVFLLAVVALMFTFIFKKFRNLELTDSDPNYIVVKRISFQHPFSSLTFLLITFFLISLPNMPLIMIGILGIILLFLSMIFLRKIIGVQGQVIVKIVLILYIFNFFEILSWYFGSYSRLFITAESLLAMFLIYKYALPVFIKKKKNAHPFVKRFGILSLVLIILFCVAFLSNMFGFMNLAVLTLKIGIKTAAIAVIIFSAHAVLRSNIHALVEIGRNSGFRLVDNGWDNLEKRAIQLLDLLAVVYLIKFILQTMEIYRPFMDWFSDFLVHQWEIGTLRISIGGILSMILILAFTFGLGRFVKIIIEDKALAKTNLPKGVPAAISATIRYFIITLGVLMALSVAGIDLGKFGLLAGALGVGIGFGLQNIVNNFISGLILVYGRPVNVGDTIEVENLMGTVKSVGIRSSNVRTYDGAEVIVPNGNLISNQLINWTLSDNKRRIELKIGAAYGSDPNVILDLLKKVALDHEDVLKEPGPKALFEEFGDSSLNFRLLFWVPFEKGIGVKSDIAIGVYNIFAENNIQIPFPQVDLHVKKDDEKPVEKTKPTEQKKSEPGPVEDPELGGDSGGDSVADPEK